MASAHIDDSFKPGEVVRADDGSQVVWRGTHRGVEDGSIVRMPGHVIEEWGAVYCFERRLPGPNRLLQRADRVPEKMCAQHHGRRPDRFRMIAAERVAQCGLSKPASRVLDEDPEARERPQEPAQRQAISMCGFCEFLDALGAAGDKIGKGEPG